MSEPQTMLLRHNLKTLRLPTMLAEYAKLSREAAEKDEDYESYLLKLSELEVSQPGPTRSRPGLRTPPSRCSRTWTPSTSP